MMWVNRAGVIWGGAGYAHREMKGEFSLRVCIILE